MDIVDLDAPDDVRRIARRLESAGFETWTVGGAVRDALRGEHPGDWDLTTAARPGDIRRVFRRTVPIGIEHGTVGVLGKDGRLYEVTTFRRDVETFGRRARVVFADTLDEDLERRDFTINAVAWHPLRGEVRDPHGGAEDLRRGVLRTVGDAGARFEEDRLRVLRALRFAGRFDLEVAPATWQELAASADRLDNLSPERVREELYKVLGGQAAPSRSLSLYERSGVLAALYPELQACVGQVGPEGMDCWALALSTADAVPRTRPILRLAALLHLVGWAAGEAGKAREGGEDSVGEVEEVEEVRGAGVAPNRHEAREEDQNEEAREDFDAHKSGDRAAAGSAIVWRMMRRLRTSNADANRVAHLVAQHAPLPAARAPAPELRRWLRRVGDDYWRDLLRLRIAIERARGCPHARDLLELIRRLRRLARERPALNIADLAIGGAELRAAGIPAGPLYGEILRGLLERVTDDPSLNTRERLIAIVESDLS